MMPDPPVFGVEVGVYAGVMAERMLREWPGLTLHMIDPWAVVPPSSGYAATGDPTTTRSAREWERVLGECRRRVTPFGDRAKIIRAYDADVLELYDRDSLDFVYIDSDHSYAGVLSALRRWHPRVKRGGLVCGHDYHEYADMSFGVIRAVDEWTTRNGYELMTGAGKVWGYVKP